MIRDEHAWMDTQVNRLTTNPPEEPAVATTAPRFTVEHRTGQNVSFRLADVYAPPLPDLFKQMTPNLELEGNIVLLSDGGDSQAAYALVEVNGILLPLIVPAACLMPVTEAPLAKAAAE